MLSEKILVNDTNYSFKKEYKSKNKVELIKIHTLDENKYYIKKSISNHKKMSKEIDVLNYLKRKNLTVPEVLFQFENSYTREYIEGETLYSLLNNLEENQKKKFMYSKNMVIIVDFLDWLDCFYNFIYNNKNIYGLDFESCKIGEKEKDIGKFLSNLLNKSNPFTNWKSRFTRQVLKTMPEYGYNLSLVKKEIYKGLKLNNKTSDRFKDLIIERIFSFHK